MFGSGRCWWRGGGGEWMRGLGLDFTNTVVKWGVLDVCFGCGGVGGEWVAGLNQGLEGWSWYLCIVLGVYRCN